MGDFEAEASLFAKKVDSLTFLLLFHSLSLSIERSILFTLVDDDGPMFKV